MLNQLNQGAYG